MTFALKPSSSPSSSRTMHHQLQQQHQPIDGRSRRRYIRHLVTFVTVIALCLFYWDADARAGRSLAEISSFASMGGVYAREEEGKTHQKRKQQQQQQQAVVGKHQQQHGQGQEASPRDLMVQPPPYLQQQPPHQNSSIHQLPTQQLTTATVPHHTCLTPDCIHDKAEQLARAFPDKTNKDDWCLSESSTKSNKNKEGLLLVKVPKAASSTAAGVALRIAHRNNCQAIQWQHKPGVTYAHRNLNKSLLITSIRDPASRILSYLFFLEVSIQQQPYTEEWLLDRLKHFRDGRYGGIGEGSGQGGFTMQFAALETIELYSAWSPTDRETVQNPTAVEAHIDRMLSPTTGGYDFMLVVDRMDESLVVLALLLDIDVADVLVTSSKVAGSYFYDAPHNQCVELTPSIKSPAVLAYLASDDWRAQNYGDYVLHAAASQSLDLTIARFQKEQGGRFDIAMERYQRLKAAETEQCAPTVEFPCSKTGRPQAKLARKECYARDFGCGYHCIDDMIANLDGIGSSSDGYGGGGGNSIPTSLLS